MAARVEIVGPGEGELMIPGPNEMRIVQDGSSTENRLGVGVITMAAHTAGPAAHWHAEHDEGFYVVSGTPRFTVEDGTERDAPAGTWIMVPRGAAHAFANPGAEGAVIVNTFTPDLYVGYFRESRDLIESGQPLSTEAVTTLRERYATYPAESDEVT